MSMVLGDLLNMIRQDYLDTLQAAAEEARATGAKVVSEPMGTLEAPTLGTLLWGDLLLNNKPVKVPSEGVFAFEDPITFGWGDELPGQPAPLQVMVQPFAWDAMQLQLKVPAGKNFNPTPLTQWLEQWGLEAADEPEEKLPSHSFREAVHSLYQTSALQFLADLGSAPLEAWQDLLEALLAGGASAVTFSSPKA